MLSSGPEGNGQNIMYSQMFLELEQTAKESGRGLWSIQGRLNWLDEQRQSMYLEMSRMQAQIDELTQRITADEAIPESVNSKSRFTFPLTRNMGGLFSI